MDTETAPIDPYQAFGVLDLRVGRITRAEINKKARVPAYKLWIDFGLLGEHTSSAQITLEGNEGWVDEALLGAQSNTDAQQMPILPLQFLVLMKFRVGRVQDVADVTRMLGQASSDDLEGVRGVFAQWLPDDQADLESLIVLGQLEMQSDPHLPPLMG